MPKTKQVKEKKLIHTYCVFCCFREYFKNGFVSCQECVNAYYKDGTVSVSFMTSEQEKEWKKKWYRKPIKVLHESMKNNREVLKGLNSRKKVRKNDNRNRRKTRKR